MMDDLKRAQDDNPTVGIILCTDKDASVVRYSVLHENEQIFASRYKTRSSFQRGARCKTEISRKPVPLDPWVAEELLTWKLAAPYNQPGGLGLRQHTEAG
jgi:hypothetical protein